MADYTLHCFAQSGNAYKPALALELAGADWAPRFVDYFGGETRSPAYRALNVMGEVPVLEHGGCTLAQSGVILDYLAGTLGRYGPRDDDERREILRWLLWDNHKLTSYTATYRFMRALAKDPDPGAMAEFGKRARAAWSVLDAHLAGRRYVVGDRLTIADFSVAVTLPYAKKAKIPLDEFPNIARWHDRLNELPAWREPFPAPVPDALAA